MDNLETFRLNAIIKSLAKCEIVTLDQERKVSVIFVEFQNQLPGFDEDRHGSTATLSLSILSSSQAGEQHR